jgi:hypothetical protein
MRGRQCEKGAVAGEDGFCRKGRSFFMFDIESF